MKQFFPQFGFLIILFILSTQSFTQVLSTHPRILFNKHERDVIIEKIRPGGRMHEDFVKFTGNKIYIEIPRVEQMKVESSFKRYLLGAMLNRVMKNAFLYNMGYNGIINGKEDGINPPTKNYYPERERYLENIDRDLRFLMDFNDFIKNYKFLPVHYLGYAMKAVAIAYDWGYDFYKERNGKHDVDANTLKKSLKKWGEWFLSNGNVSLYPERYRYWSSVYANHGPWDTKGLAYLAVALGPEEKLYDDPDQASYLNVDIFGNEDVKEQVCQHPVDRKAIRGKMKRYAKPYFDQILAELSDKYSGPVSPRGGWHESVMYFLVLEIPNLLEYAEIVCTYYNDPDYTKSVFSNNIFKYAGDFLFHMTTPDGMFMKYGDTGQKTALPSEFFDNEGRSYGDINNIGAGYIGGYYLYRLYHRLKDLGPEYADHAELVKFYADQYCFDFSDPFSREPAKDPLCPTEYEWECRETRINYLYKFLWQTGDPETEPRIEWNDLRDNTLTGQVRYYDNIGVFISRQYSHDSNKGTIVRFDGQPWYYNSHQHFAAGNFTIFKRGNLAIDGGRYIAGGSNAKDDPRYNYSFDYYRSSSAHNVVLFKDGETEIGQDSYKSFGVGNVNPYVASQLPAFQDYATGKNNVSIVYTEKNDPLYPYSFRIRSMRVILDSVYTDAGVRQYHRFLVHLTRERDQETNNPDFVLVYDWIDMEPTVSKEAIWQMHFRDNGNSSEIAPSTFLVRRNENIPRGYVKNSFGKTYQGEMLIKCLLPFEPQLTVKEFRFPDELCNNCWNGRVWEESNHILQFNSPVDTHHEFLTVLYPSTTDTMLDYSGDIVQVKGKGIQLAIILKSQFNPIPGHDRNLVVGFVPSQQPDSLQYDLSLTAVSVELKTAAGEWQFKGDFETKRSYPGVPGWGVIAFETDFGTDPVQPGNFNIRMKRIEN
jgi:hypothetical protein